MNEMKTNPFDKDAALTTILTVKDIAQSKKFYQDVLGAEIFREYGGTSMVIQLLGNWILLVTGGGETEDKPGTEFVPPINPNKISHAFTVRVKNCWETYESLKGRGAIFLTTPVTSGSEIRCFFYDPDGHLFEISEYSG